MYITVESLYDTPFEIPLWSALYLESDSPAAASDIGRTSNRILAAVDPAVLDPFNKVGLVNKQGEKADSTLVRLAHSEI